MSALRVRVRLRARLGWLIGSLLLASPALAQQQTDTARVSYRTREIVFVTAGRLERLAVGDTVEILGHADRMLAPAVVVSVAQHSASAQLLDSSAEVVVGQLVRFHPGPAPEPEVARAPADTAAARGLPAAADTAAAYVLAPAAPRGHGQRWRGGLTVEHYASSSGLSGSLSTHQRVAALDLTAPLASGIELALRGSGRWRGGASASLAGSSDLTALVYEAELRIAPPGARWSASLGRFLPGSALGLGYLDGARVDLRVASAHRLGLVGGVVPRAYGLRFSSDTRRLGAYWAFGSGSVLDGSLSAAADWGGGARRRTEIAFQSSWRPSHAVRVSSLGELDLPVPGGAFGAAQLSTLYAGIDASLPLGLRGALAVESHQAIRLWDPALPADTAPLPGRLNGASLSLSRDVLGLALNLSGGVLKRHGDARATVRGTLTASRGGFLATGTLQHGDLADYAAVLARVAVPPRLLPFTLSLGVMASATRTGGWSTLWRYGLRPELSWYAGRGVFASLGGDVGTYAGHSFTWLHAGVSYRFR